MTTDQTATLDLLGIGNALVDVLAPAEESFIAAQVGKGMNRGAMNLIDAGRALDLYDAMGPATEVSGGSAANTMAVFASFGGRGGYIGKVGNDQLGGVFAHDIQSLGVTFKTAPSDTPTGRCMVLVTPDGERTMNTFLGAAAEVSPGDIDDAMVASAAVTYLEGYLFDQPPAMAAFVQAADAARSAGRKVALSLSDAFCVHRHGDEFRKLVAERTDILFANEDEITALYGLSFDESCARAAQTCETVAVTRGASGSAIFQKGQRHDAPAEAVAKVVDTTGAGDAYAAGFLFGYTRGRSMAECGKLGALAAAEVISHMGPRPLVSLKAMAA